MGPPEPDFGAAPLLRCTFCGAPAGPPIKMEQDPVGLRERRLSPQEVEEVLGAVSSFRRSKAALAVEDTRIFEALREPLRPALSEALVALAPGSDGRAEVGRLKASLRGAFLSALATPGISYGARAASDNAEPLIQAVLKAAQAAGAREGERPVDELLTMPEHRGTEIVYAAPDIGLPAPELYSLNPGAVPELSFPSLDDLIALSMSMIEPPIHPMVVRTAGGASVQTSSVKDLADARLDPLIAAGALDLEHLRRGAGLLAGPRRKVFLQTIRFSVPEALKVHQTPHSVLERVRRYLAAEPEGYRGSAPCHAALSGFGPMTFDVLVYSPDPSVSLAAACGAAQEGGGELEGFEIGQVPVLGVPTDIEEVDTARLGLLAPRQKNGSPARAWNVHLLNPRAGAPAKSLAYMLSYLGLQIVACSRNAAGRCTLLRVAEWEGSTGIAAGGGSKNFREWAEGRLGRDQAMQGAPGAPAPAPPQSLDTWRDPSLTRAEAISTYYVVKFKGSGLTTGRFLRRPEFDPDSVFTNLIPEMNRLYCSWVARQVMDDEWSYRVATGRVTQFSADVVTLYACGMGPMLQSVKGSAVAAGGPMAGLNEDANRRLTAAALKSRTYSSTGSQANIATGTASRTVGASSIVPLEAPRGGAQGIEQAESEGAGEVASVRRGRAAPQDRPVF